MIAATSTISDTYGNIEPGLSCFIAPMVMKICKPV